MNKVKSRCKVTFSRRERRMCIALGVGSPLLIGLVLIFLSWTETWSGGTINSLVGLVNLGEKLNSAVHTAILNKRAHDEGYKNKTLAALNPVKDKVVLLVIDDETLHDNRFNEWPIPRSRYAEMIGFLEKAGAKAIGIDILFENHQKAYPKADAQLARALRASKNTIIVDTPYSEPLDLLTEGWSEEEKLTKIGITYEADETITSVPLVVPLKGRDRYAFDALLAARALDVPVASIEDHSTDGHGWGYIKIGNVTAPVLDGAMQINFRWPGSLQQDLVQSDAYGNAFAAALSINYFPLSTLWEMTESDREYYFKDRIVLVGVTVVAGNDVKTTPIGKMAGVEIHANILLNILSGDFLRIVPVQTVVIVSLALSLLLGIYLPRLDPRVGALMTLGLLIAVFWSTYVLLAGHNVWFRPALPLFSIVLAFALITFYLIRAERRAKMLMKTLFEKATPVREDDVIKFLLSGKTEADDFETQLEVRERTVLFSDIRDYTVMSESMNADRVMKTLNVYYSEMQMVINECGGKIWEYVGDAQMVIFGEKAHGRYPPECQVRPEYANLKPADQAVHAAINMVARLEQLNADARSKGMPVLDIGIGVNSGPVSLGTIKNKGKLVFACIGDTTNVAARMQAMSKDLKCRILLSESTFDQLEDIYLSEKVENVKVKGKAEPMTVYRVFAGQQARERENVATPQ